MYAPASFKAARRETPAGRLDLSMDSEILGFGKEGCARETREGCPAPLQSEVLRTSEEFAKFARRQTLAGRLFPGLIFPAKSPTIGVS